MHWRQGQNLKLARVHNRALVMKTIVQAGEISRKDLADRIGLTRAAISVIADELIARGFIGEAADSRSAAMVGRRPIPLRVDPQRFRIMIIYIGRLRIENYLTNAKAEILQRRFADARPLLASRDGISKALLRHAKQLVSDWGVRVDDCFGLAVTAPGPVKAGGAVDARPRGTRYDSPYLWEDLRTHLASGLGCPVFVENDANVMGLGEHWFGSGQACDHFVLYSIGEGLGSAAVIRGMPYRGHNNVAGEIGHITVRYDGPRCSCGNDGCLELYAGFKVLRAAYRERKGVRGRSDYYTDLEELFRLYNQGDPDCRELVERHANLVAVGAVSLSNMFSPEKIIVASYEGGAVTLDPFVAAMRQAVRKKAFSAIGRDMAVEASGLGVNIIPCGGTALVMNELLSGAGGSVFDSEFPA